MCALTLSRHFRFNAAFKLCFPGVRTEVSCNIETTPSLLSYGDSPNSDVVESTHLPRARGDTSLPASVEEVRKNEPS